MAKQTRKNLSDRTGIVKVETVPGANTAPRIGGILKDIIDTLPSDFDETVSYGAGEEAIWQGRIVTCFSPTLAGQSPLTHPAKWTDWVADSVTKLISGLSNFPVLPSALIPYVSQRIAEVNAAQGGVPEASADELTIGLIHNKYVSPARLKVVIDALYEAIAAVQAAGSTTGSGAGTGTGSTTPAATPTLDQVTAAGERTTNNLITAQGSNHIVELSAPNAQGGYYFWLKDVHTILGGIINLDADQIAFFNRYIALTLNGHDVLLNADRLIMPNTGVSLATIQRTQKPAATVACNGLWGPQPDPNTGQSMDVLYSGAQVFSFIRAELDEYVLQRNLGGKPSSPGPVGTIYCRPTPASTPTTPTSSAGGITEKFFTVTAAQLGTLRTHGLGVAGAQIWPILLGPDNKDASSYVSISFPDNNSFKVTADNPETAADSSFYVKVNLRVIPQ